MSISEIAEDYLFDQKEGMRKLTAWLLNEVMQAEAANQIQAQPYERTTDKRNPWRSELNLDTGPLRFYRNLGTLPR